MDANIISQEQLSKEFSWSDKHLRSYQLEGVNWILGSYNKNHGCILGDEMGLGKTCQTIGFLSVTAGRISKCSHLVICPRSVLENWEKEFQSFNPGLNVKVYIGDKEHRVDLANEIKQSRHVSPYDVILTTYEMCLRDHLFFQSMKWHVLVVDEAHRLKNHESLLYTTLDDWDFKMKLLLTGTPIQNNLRELYALFSFIDRETFRLSKLERFVQKYSNEKQDVKELLELMEPYLLRRTKTQVLVDLPEKTDIVLYHSLSALQKKLYKAILTKDIGVFETGYGSNNTRLMNILMQLRKCVNHPYLFDGVEEEPFQLGEHLVDASSKLCLIDRLLDSLKQDGHKVLMFSQMTRMLDILQDYLGYRGYSYERLDGSVRGEERFLAVQNFNKNEDTFVFLLSTKAGGQGLNLTSADTVIFVDSDFNPQNDLQAAARAHRIGQDRPVKIIRLIGRNTVEEIILKRAEDKLRLTEKVIESGHFAAASKNKRVLGGETSRQLQEMLKFGVDDLLDESKSDESIDFQSVLGHSKEGRWIVEDQENSQSTKATAISEEADATPSQNIYVFEGTDYSKEPSAADLKAFEQLLKVEKEAMEVSVQGEKNLRRTGTNITGLFPIAATSKPRKQLTVEQLEERKKKMQEAVERKAKLAEERKAQQVEKQRLKKERLWLENKYTSNNFVLVSDGEEEDKEEEAKAVFSDSDDDEDEEDKEDAEMSGEKTQRKKLPINYALGDVTKPKQIDDYDNIVVHCVDDSGSWGRGGVFSALSACSNDVAVNYEMAGQMDDLHLGDCHMFRVQDVRSIDDERFWVALLVAQHRDKRNNLSGLDLAALQQGLQRVCQAAQTKKASVHLPRIGYDTPKFNWYATERLIRKHLSSRGISTSIYYFPRKTGTKKRNGGPSTTPLAKLPRRDDGPSGSSSYSNVITSTPSSSSSSVSNKMKLSSIFSDLAIHFHSTVSPDEMKKMKRFVLAYDGDIHKEVTEYTTHIIAPENADKQDLSRLLEGVTDCCVVVPKWLEVSISKGDCVPCKEYQVSLQ